MAKQGDYFLAKNLCEWKIENFLDRECNKEGSLRSPKFSLCGTNFFFNIYPNGKDEYNAGWVSLFLCKVPSRTRPFLEFTLGLKRDDGSVLVARPLRDLFPFIFSGKGFPRLIEKSNLTSDKKGAFGPRGTLTVFCEVCCPAVKDDDDSAENDINSAVEAFETWSKAFEEIFISGWKTDAVLDVRGKRFSAHRLILSARSSVFRSMFEIKEETPGLINITDCDPETFGVFLLFLYNGKLDIVTLENALSLYTIASKYNVKELKKECCECWTRELSIDSICSVLHIAALHKEQELLKSATTFFMKNANKILTTAKWQTLLKENPTLANELFIGTLNKMDNS